MVTTGMCTKSTLLALLVVNVVHFGKGLAADRNHRWSSDDPAVTDVDSTKTDAIETTPLQNASHSGASVATHDSANYSRKDGREREAGGKLSEKSVANRPLSNSHSHGSISSPVSNNSANKTTANLNVSSTDHALNESSKQGSAASANFSQAENILRATLCANVSVEKETMRIEVEFASTLLENGLYRFVTFNEFME